MTAHPLELPRFGGLDPDETTIERARVVLIPVPYDRTASYQKGTADGPRALLEASTHMELYDEELAVEPYRIGIHTLEAPSGNDDPPERMVEEVESATERCLAMGKMPVVVGGEHSVSVGAIRACHRRHPKMSVVQLDAHGDLRNSFEGSIYNHACVMHRVVDLGIPTVQLGIRSLSREEADLIRDRRLVVISARQFLEHPGTALEAVDRLTDEIYLTVDVDYFDPAILPGTGTPEPGGPGWYETLTFLRELCRRKKVVGFDVNELRPMEDDKASDFLAAKLVYKVIAYRFFAEGRRAD
jgi:N1-aminopropylagmatine ureohydrolase